MTDPSKTRAKRLFGLLPMAAALTACGGGRPEVQPELRDPAPDLQVRLVTDQAEATLAILIRLEAGDSVSSADWAQLFGTEGYRRLRKREMGLGRSFEDAAFREFLYEEARRSRGRELAGTLERWRALDIGGAAARAAAYLPAGTPLRAFLYPVIKPQSNSFVFELGGDSAAIFLYLDPELEPARLENTLAHELHHVGYARACPSEDGGSAEPTGLDLATGWMGAFGEGVAMLAAAGGPAVHPHAASSPDDRARWDRDVAAAGSSVAELERFFLDVIEGRIADPGVIQSRAMSFFGIQGPWYTVGWLMAATIEQTFGRDRLVASLCSPERLLLEYDAAVAARPSGADPLPRWSPRLLDHLRRV